MLINQNIVLVKQSEVGMSNSYAVDAGSYAAVLSFQENSLLSTIVKTVGIQLAAVGIGVTFGLGSMVIMIAVGVPVAVANALGVVISMLISFVTAFGGGYLLNRGW